MVFRPLRNPTRLDRRHDPNRHASAYRSHWRSPKTVHSPGTQRVFYWLFDHGVPVRLRFRGQNLAFVNNTAEARLMVALLTRVDTGSLVSWADAQHETRASTPAALRQTKCRLNRLLAEKFGPLFGAAASVPTREAGWIICRHGHGLLLNPAANFISKSGDDNPHVATGRFGDVADWAVDRL